MREFDIFFNRLCQSCCQFDLIGWVNENKLVCGYCHKHNGKFYNLPYMQSSKGKTFRGRTN